MSTILWVVAAVASVSVVFSVAVVALAMRGAGRPTLEERYERAWAMYVRDTDGGIGGGNTEPGAEPSSPATADVEAVPTPTTEPEPTPTETPLAATSQRGNLIKAIGDTAFMYETLEEMREALETKERR